MVRSCSTEGDDSKHKFGRIHVLLGGSSKMPYVPGKLELIGLSTFRGSCWGYVPPPRRLQAYLQPSWSLVSLWFYLES